MKKWDPRVIKNLKITYAKYENRLKICHSRLENRFIIVLLTHAITTPWKKTLIYGDIILG